MDLIIIVAVCLIILFLSNKNSTHKTLDKILYNDDIEDKVIGNDSEVPDGTDNEVTDENKVKPRDSKPSKRDKEKSIEVSDIPDISDDVKIDSQILIKEILGDG